MLTRLKNRTRWNLTQWIVWHLPDRWVYHVLFRAWGYATQQVSDEPFEELTMDQVTRFWAGRKR